MSQRLIFTNEVAGAVTSLVGELAPASVHIVTDTTVARQVLPLLGLPYPVVAVPGGDINKTIENVSAIWRALSNGGATRRSLVINIGGGMVTDMGAFAAATFKRGVRFINVPTTLLGAVDAAVGGKTGCNLDGLKNEVGVFAPADAVVISSAFFATLPPSELLSGYAEMVKHGLLEGPAEFSRLIAGSPLDLTPAELLTLLEENVRTKSRIVAEDPTEKGIRKALNLGHTIGHAFETLGFEKNAPVPHGYAVAHGLLVELILSHLHRGFPSSELHRYRDFMRRAGYGTLSVSCDDYPRLLELMTHDKKNATPDAISFTLLDAPGSPQTGIVLPRDLILSALDIYRELL